VALIKTYKEAPLDEMGHIAVAHTYTEGKHMIGVKVVGDDFRTAYSLMVMSDQEAQVLVDLLNIVLKKTEKRHAH
jgi:hypothetical protein